jgi:hypothetical protein
MARPTSAVTSEGTVEKGTFLMPTESLGLDGFVSNDMLLNQIRPETRPMVKTSDDDRSSLVSHTDDEVQSLLIFRDIKDCIVYSQFV